MAVMRWELCYLLSLGAQSRRTYVHKSCTWILQNIHARSTYTEPVQQSAGEWSGYCL